MCVSLLIVQMDVFRGATWFVVSLVTLPGHPLLDFVSTTVTLSLSVISGLVPNGTKRSPAYPGYYRAVEGARYAEVVFSPL